MRRTYDYNEAKRKEKTAFLPSQCSRLYDTPQILRQSAYIYAAVVSCLTIFAIARIDRMLWNERDGVLGYDLDEVHVGLSAVLVREAASGSSLCFPAGLRQTRNRVLQIWHTCLLTFCNAMWAIAYSVLFEDRWRTRREFSITSAVYVERVWWFRVKRVQAETEWVKVTFLAYECNLLSHFCIPLLLCS